MNCRCYPHKNVAKLQKMNGFSVFVLTNPSVGIGKYFNSVIWSLQIGGFVVIRFYGYTVIGSLRFYGGYATFRKTL